MARFRVGICALALGFLCGCLPGSRDTRPAPEPLVAADQVGTVPEAEKRSDPAVEKEKATEPETRPDLVTPAAQLSAQVSGLFVCRGPNATPVEEVNFPFIDGWLVRPRWHMVEPREGQFDWSFIDGEIALAKRLNKKITLMVLGGPHTPEWVYRAGARAFHYTMPPARARVTQAREAKIPVLWDEVYLRKWTALITALGRRYGHDGTVVLVHVTGATKNGLEMQLPFSQQDRREWQRIGYTPEKVIAAWKRILDLYALAFPNTPLDIDIHPVLDSEDVPRQVLAYGSSKLGKRFGIFAGWLSGKSAAQDSNHAGMFALAQHYGPLGFAAFQMIASETNTPEMFAQGGLREAVAQGMSWNARYFEVWAADAMNPSLHPILREIQGKLHSE
jgi:hypothetical protein